MAGWDGFLHVAAIALPLLVLLGLALYALRRRRVAARLGDRRLVRQVTGTDLHRLPWLRIVLVTLAAAALGGALGLPAAAPSAAAADTVPERMVLVLDASTSMLVRDAAPNRLEQARAFARELVGALDGVAIGLVAFAGRAYVLAPPTPDPAAVRLYLDALDPSIVTQSGTSLSAALRQAVALAAARDGVGAVVLVSDGDLLEPADVLQATLEIAARVGVRVFAVGTGSEAGGAVPEFDFDSGRILGPKLGPDGTPVTSALRPEVLREIARATGGEYVEISGPTEAASAARSIARSLGASPAPPPGRPLPYTWLVIAALALLAADAALHAGAARR